MELMNHDWCASGIAMVVRQRSASRSVIVMSALSVLVSGEQLPRTGCVGVSSAKSGITLP